MHGLVQWCYDALSIIFMISLICLFSLIILVCIFLAICLAFLTYTAGNDPPVKEPNPQTKNWSAFIKKMFRD